MIRQYFGFVDVLLGCLKGILLELFVDSIYLEIKEILIKTYSGIFSGKVVESGTFEDELPKSSDRVCEWR